MGWRKFGFVLMTLLVLAVMAAGSAAQDDVVTFYSTQFNTVEEGETFRQVLDEYGGILFVGQDEAAVLDLVRAEADMGDGTVDIVGALHGSFPTLARVDALMNLADVLEDIEDRSDIPDAFVELGRLGTDDYQYYVPWMQATYIMAANVQALDYLPEGADVNALTWEQFAQWCENLATDSGQPRCGLPIAGLFHRFLQGYMYPSFTGGMVTRFDSDEAVTMFEFLRDDLWPYIYPKSLGYEFMQEPLLTGEVWVAFDHTARLIDAFNQQPETFIAFPAPAGPAGRGFMPVLAGLAIPKTSRDPEAAMDVIDYLTSPDVQVQVLSQLAFFPVVSGVDTSNVPEGIALEAAAVEAQANAPDALPALLPVGLGERGGEINEIYRSAFTRTVIDGEDIPTVLGEEATRLQTLLTETGAPCWPPDEPSAGACEVE